MDQKSTKQPMKSLPIPTLPLQIISQDIFMHRQKAYLVTVCHFSDWIEVDELDDTLAPSVINKTKAHFAKFGIPRICHTDNGPQSTSKDYMDFASQYGSTHTTSSPYHFQGNGRAEAAVKVSESMLKKSDDFQIALLNYRNTPPKATPTPLSNAWCAVGHERCSQHLTTFLSPCQSTATLYQQKSRPNAMPVKPTMTRPRVQNTVQSILVNLCMHDHRQASQETHGRMAVSPKNALKILNHTNAPQYHSTKSDTH